MHSPVGPTPARAARRQAALADYDVLYDARFEVDGVPRAIFTSSVVDLEWLAGPEVLDPCVHGRCESNNRPDASSSSTRRGPRCA
jgi:hypothetical protein